MKTIFPHHLLLFILLTFVLSCKNEESPFPSKGKVTFSFFHTARGNGRIKETAPAFVLLNIKDSNGEVQENIKLVLLYDLGQDYVSEHLELQTGNYQVIQFAILDEFNKIMHATPREGSALARHVNDPLPIDFSVTAAGVQVAAEVLTVLEDDRPEQFGLANFRFEIVHVSVKLISEEYFIYDPENPASTGGFVGSHKTTFRYDQNKLVQTDVCDYNVQTHTYLPGYKFEEFQYDSNDKLARKIQFVGDSGLKWIHEYEYLSNESTRVTRYQSNSSDAKKLQDWWVVEKRPASFTVKYYNVSNERYAELNCEMDRNVISEERNPPFPAGKIYYKYDNSPNPYKFPELAGAYGLDTEKYLSQNNVIEITNDSNTKSTRAIEYNKEGYPVIIIAPTYKRVLAYQ
jgi:hypothetical protein